MTYHQGLSDGVLHILDINSQIASVNVNGLTIDTQGWDGIEYKFVVGTMANGATFDARVVSSANSNMSGNTNLTNAAITQMTNASNANLVIIDVWRPTNRYVRSAVQAGTANSTFGCVATLYRRTGTTPVTQNANTKEVVKVAVN